MAATGVDGLAVAVGSSHAMTRSDGGPRPRPDRPARGAPSRCRSCCTAPRACRTPALRAAVAAGIRKVNVGTALNVGYTARVRQFLADDETVTDPRKYLTPARDAVRDTVTELAAALGRG